jgi:hypothetical protein
MPVHTWLEAEYLSTLNTLLGGGYHVRRTRRVVKERRSKD